MTLARGLKVKGGGEGGNERPLALTGRGCGGHGDRQTHTHGCPRMWMHVTAHPGVCPDMPVCPEMHRAPQLSKHECAHTHTHTCVQTQHNPEPNCTHVRNRLVQTDMCTCGGTLQLAHMCARTHTHTWPDTCTCADIPRHMHAHVHTHTHVYCVHIRLCWKFLGHIGL